MRFNFRLFVTLLLFISLLKLALGFNYHHGDADQYYFWGKFLAQSGFNHFYEWGIPNSMPPTYPPVVYYVLFATRKLYLSVREFVWFFHLRVSLGPFRRLTSAFIPWYETKSVAHLVNKIPAIIADALNCIMIYKILVISALKRKKNFALVLALIFALSPPVWYSSSIWGQVDSIYIFFLLSSLYFLLKKNITKSAVFMVIAGLTKPTAFYAAPIFLYVFLKEGNLKIWRNSILLSLVLIFFLYLPFDQSGNFLWIFPFFKSSLSGELNQMLANAFNFWALLFGFDNRPDFSLLAGEPLYLWGYGLFVLFALFIFLAVIKKRISFKTVFLAGFLFSLAAFLVLPRVHERYFYPALIFSILLSAFSKDWLIIFLLLSIINFFNLYHFWWIPRFEPLVSFLSNMTIIRIMVLVEIFIFFYGLVKLSLEKSK